MVNVEVVYAPKESPVIHLRLTMAEGSTVENVLHQSGLFDSHPEVSALSVGIFSKLVDYTTLIKSGDRIEIYRALAINPMEKRRLRAKQT